MDRINITVTSALTFCSRFRCFWALAIFFWAATSIGQTDVAAKSVEQTLRLVSLSAEKMESALQGLLGERIRPLENMPAGSSGSVFAQAPGRRVNLLFTHQQNEVTLRGPEALVDQFTRMILAVERASVPAGRAVCIVSLRQSDPVQVMRIIETYRNGRPDAQTSRIGNLHPATLLSRMPPAGKTLQATYRCQSPDVPAAGSQATSPNGAGPAAAQAPPATQQPPASEENAAEPSNRLRLRSLDSDLEVETLPDLDAIILRGRHADVQELRRIIEELERLSVETQPQIEILYLKNVNCEPLATIVKQVDKDLVAGRQGRVSVLPLIKPNAMLLIGWGESLKSVKDLVQKLDLPVAPETQFRVFHLRYAAAAESQTAIQTLFASHAGLATQVKIIADSRTNALIVQASPRDLDEVDAIIQRLDQPQGTAVRQARVFPLRNSLAADVASVLQNAIGTSRVPAAGHKNAALEFLSVDAKGQKLLRAGVLNDVQITPDVRANTLIIAGPVESMELLEALIHQLDTPSSVAQIKVFRVLNGDATSLVTMLKALLPSAAGSAVTPLAAADGESSLIPVRFSVDLRTNSIIATGSQEQLMIIEALLLRLDEDKGTPRKNAVYQLRNAPADAAARAINEFLRSERQVQQTTPGVVNPFQQIESEVVVVPEKVSNSLIVSATPRFFDDIMELVKKLDAEPPQVIIQVVIAEIALNNINEFGIEVGLQDGLLFNRSLLGSLVTTTSTTQTSTPSGIITQSQTNILGASNTPGFAFNNAEIGNSGSTKSLSSASQVGSQGLSNFGVTRTSSDTGYGGLVLSASSESVSALIRALKETSRLDVLSRPQVMTLDNQPAFVQVGKRVPRIASASITQVGQQNAIVLENVGLILGVTPRISPDGRVIMEVDAEKSELGSVEDGIPVTTSGNTVIKSPTIDLTTAQTTVSAIDGETIIIGGLITRNKKDIERRVPLLSDIPLLGLLFRYDSHANKRTEMLIILTPHIVRSPEDAERIRAMEESRMHWCLGDVNEIDGPVGFSAKTEAQPVATVYPDKNPRGKIAPPPPPEAVQEPRPDWTPQAEPLPLDAVTTPSGDLR